MKALHRGLFLVPLLAAVASAPAMAQSWKWDWGVNGGYALFTPSLDDEDTGAGDVKFKAGPLIGTQLGFWFTPKFGLRLNGRYADRPLEESETDTELVANTNLWGATADLMFRFKAPAEEFTGTEVLPYLALGFGAKWHNPAGDAITCTDVPEQEAFACAPFVLGSNGFALGEKNSIAGLVGLGADWRIARSVAIRTEISDQIYKPKIYNATIPPAGSANWSLPNDEIVSKLTHEIAAQIGLHFLFGLAAPPVVAVAPPPAPPPPPPPPPPPAEPRRESISVCVIDPTAPGGVRMQAATLVEGRDTVVTVGGTDRPLRESVGNVMVAGNAPWYVQGQPLTMTVGRNTVEFATYGTTRVVEATDLAYVGTVNGYPVYADRDDVADVIDELNQLNQSRAGTDLGVLLNDNRTLRTEFTDVKVLYVPTTATGCVFQAVQRQEEVRKGGK